MMMMMMMMIQTGLCMLMCAQERINSLHKAKTSTLEAQLQYSKFVEIIAVSLLFL